MSPYSKSWRSTTLRSGHACVHVAVCTCYVSVAVCVCSYGCVWLCKCDCVYIIVPAVCVWACSYICVCGYVHVHVYVCICCPRAHNALHSTSIVIIIMVCVRACVSNWMWKPDNEFYLYVDITMQTAQHSMTIWCTQSQYYSKALIETVIQCYKNTLHALLKLLHSNGHKWLSTILYQARRPLWLLIQQWWYPYMPWV